MSTVRRKSSTGGGRRGALKPHVPYRGDNPEVGKKTGVAVRHVQRMSDGFEPFEELGRKKTPMPVFDPILDEDGEMSMELDDTPVRYFQNSQAAIPSQLHRASVSSRVSNVSEVDFDRVPSPRPRTTSRKSLANGTGPGPSTLSHSVIAGDEPDPDGGSLGGFESDFDDHNAQQGFAANHSSRKSPFRRASFVEMDQDEPDEGELEEPPNTARNGSDKGKERATSIEAPQPDPQPDDDNDMDIQDFEDFDNEPGGSDAEREPEPEPEPTPPPKKAKVSGEKPKKTGAQTGSRSKKENRPIREGVRRSAREIYKPLEWWRGEKVVYGRSEHGPTLVPNVKEIHRIPKDLPVPLGSKRKRTRARSKSKVPNPEEGWDKDTEPQAIVLDYNTGEEVQRRIAWTADMVAPAQVGNSDWSFQKIFGDGDFMAAGQLTIPPNSRKPSKGTKDNTYIFYVVEGAVNLKIHETSLILATGGTFMVPRGNTYFIENIADRTATLFFTQARKIPVGEDEVVTSERLIRPSTEAPPLRSAARSSPATTPKAEPTGRRAASKV
ncbi:Mif2/CENP-C like-domain-containing protein [Infundibulicybe gibba]|nr:Mif2/CENP-C like-domain-containing protein [Infundibulicybe gibba]